MSGHKRAMQISRLPPCVLFPPFLPPFAPFFIRLTCSLILAARVHTRNTSYVTRHAQRRIVHAVVIGYSIFRQRFLHGSLVYPLPPRLWSADRFKFYSPVPFRKERERERGGWGELYRRDPWFFDSVINCFFPFTRRGSWRISFRSLATPRTSEIQIDSLLNVPIKYNKNRGRRDFVPRPVVSCR